jgi:hypothetical protein
MADGPPARPPQARRGEAPWWKRWWVALLVFPALALGAVGLLLFFVVFSSVPLPEDIAATASMVFDVDGEEVGNLSEDVNQETSTSRRSPSTPVRR